MRPWTTQSLAQLSGHVDIVSDPDDGAIAWPGMPEGEDEGDAARQLVGLWSCEEEVADEGGEDEATAITSQYELCRGGKRCQLLMRAQDEGETGDEGDDLVEEERDQRDGEHGTGSGIGDRYV